MGRLDEKVALVTGAASGIGAAIALRFAQEGARIAGIDIQQLDDGDWAEAARLSGAGRMHKLDVRDKSAVFGAVAEVEAEFGRVDILVNSAGVAGGGPVHLIPDEEWDRVMDINLKGTLHACQAVVPGMLARQAGSIVNVASVEGIEGFEGGSAYNASKGAVILLTRNMAIDYGRRGIRVNAVCPGFIETPLFSATLENEGMADVRERIREAHQLGRFGRPEEIAHGALFLASDEASFVTGQALPVDGGYTAGHRFGIAAMMGLD
ncbi:MAG: SDR family oxidoreductase [Myxococcota bacterium]|nr:SDR family oxidoreductase [Myxococcota bacterium]